MIKFEFSQPQGRYPHGCLRVDISHSDDILDKPLSLQVFSHIDGSIKWQVSLSNGHWAEYYEPTNNTIIVKDSKGVIRKIWNWDTLLHGDFIHKYFLEWSINNKGKKGIAIGTNDGTTGEWVYPVMTGLLNAILVEASDSTFEKLLQNWKGFSNVNFQCNLITEDGRECIFYESDASATNSVSKDHVKNFNQNIREVSKNSISLNDLILQHGNDIDWLHLDVEGIDDYLVLSLDESKVNLPKIIIYESLNLDDNRKENTKQWLNAKGYKTVESNWNTIAFKD